LIEGAPKDEWQQDQKFLKKYILPVVENNMMAHDAYNCKYFGHGSKPFPRPREDYYFIGAKCDGDSIVCKPLQKPFVSPVECRPNRLATYG
jgi:hypothetical protein